MTLLLIIWGLWSASQLPVDAVPDITDNQVQIITVCPTLAGQEVEQLVTFPVEQSIANIAGLEGTRSISRFGLSVITVVFREDVNIYFARQLVNEQLKQAREQIPEGIGSPELAPVSTGLGEVYQYILHPKKGSEKKYNAKDLRTMQDWIVRRQLNGTPGIAEVNSFGGELKEYEVAVNPSRLRALGVTVTDIFNALEQNNQNTGGAYIDKKPNAYFIRGVGLVTSLEDVRKIAVRQQKGTIPVFIRDVAEVRFGHAVRYGALTYNGEVDAVGGVVMMLKGANSNEVVRSIKAKIPVIQKSLPEDVVIEPYLDRTDLVNRAMRTVEKNLIEGALIVIFVLLVFLGNLRAGLIVASAIPLSLLFALGMMKVFGVSANLMSLGAIDFGLIVDGAVIIVEATLHHLGLRKSISRLTQAEIDKEVFASASKIRSSAAFGEIIILIVYIPILTLAGVEGKMFVPMAKTVGFAILGALMLSLTYIPMMCALFLSKKNVHKRTFSDKMMDRLQAIYQPLLQKAIRFRVAVITTSVAVFFLSLWVFSRMGGEFIPQLQEGDFAFHCILPQGSSLSQSMETSMQASRIIRQFEEVKMVVGKTGSAEVPTDPMPPEATDLIIVLKPREQWISAKSYHQLANELLERLEVIPGVFFEKNQPIQMRFNELMTGIRQDVAVKVFGENMDTLAMLAEKVARTVQQVEGATQPQVERVGGLPQINVEYDRTRLANYGLTVENVNDILSTAFAGKSAGQVFENERRFDLVVRLDSTFRKDIADVNNLVVPTSTGVQVPLSQVAKIEYKLGPSQISRESGKRRIVVGFNVEGRDVESVVGDIRQKLDQQVKLPPGYYFTYGGQFENLRAASERLVIAVPVSLLLIFMLLYFTFNSARQALLIFMAIPMSAIGGVFALLIRDMPFSISAGIGFIALSGVAVLNGIVLIGTFNQLEKEGMADVLKRVSEGTRIRLRPVLMTATVASLGFLPMAISNSAGAEVQKPLATVVIGGLVTATLLTLFVLPLLYIVFSSKLKKVRVGPVAGMIIILFMLVPNLTSAQARRVKTVNEALALALENNGAVRARGLDVAAGKALLRTSGELPKTEVNAQLGRYNSNAFDQSYQVSQRIPFPTLFGARKGLLQAELKAREIARELSINELKREVRAAFYEIRYLQACRVQFRRLDSLYHEFIRVARLRHAAGDTRQTDVSAAEVRYGEISLLVRQNEVDLEAASRQLSSLLSVQGNLEIPFEEKFIPLEPEFAADSVTFSANPSVRALLQDAEVAAQNKRVERAQLLPDISLGYVNQSLTGFQNIGGEEKYFGPANRFGSFSIGLSLPLSYGAGKARARSFEYQRQSAEASARQQKAVIHAQAYNAMAQYRQDLEQFHYYEQKALPNARQIVAAAELGYRTGDVGYVEYLYALQTATDIELNYLKSIRRLNQSVINFYVITNQ